ncbi:MAG: M35 family metallo-endopeptidase [Hyalangium sp.]|uniref:M35 family metallo-endopeptidase n=1 Tax=Hyalangium sp. TaxID=2028555 RepID=UPI003899B0EF
MRIDRTTLLRTKPRILAQGATNQIADACIEDVQTHFTQLHEDVKSMEAHLTAPLNQDIANRMKWAFGDDSWATAKKVKAHVITMRKVIERAASLTVTYSSVLGDNPNVYAHVYPHNLNPMMAGSLFIYMDWRYTIKEEDELDNRYLTLVHEFSHLACKTKDYQYVPKWSAAQQLAGNRGQCIGPYAAEDFDVDKAVDNADSYGYFFAATFARAGGCTHP